MNRDELALTFATLLGVGFAVDLSAQSTTFTNPTPAAGDSFGGSVAAVGSNRVLIGAELDDLGATNAGAVYLFRTDGTLLTTFTNPAPADGDRFGTSVAAVGSDLVVIGVGGKYTGAWHPVAPYLFRTDGTLLNTFTNPTLAARDSFGASVAAVGSDRVLIGASGSEAAYLFSTNGTLLTTFINPAPAAGDSFGGSLAAVGSDRVFIGAQGDDSGGKDSGAAYLFSTNGTLLTTFTNPTPSFFAYFGNGVAVGSDRLLIGASGADSGGPNSGAAYLFSTNGTLLTTFTNPTPAAGDTFGASVAAVGSDRVLIGASANDSGATGSGAAYLFSVIIATNPPVLTGMTVLGNGTFGFDFTHLTGSNFTVFASTNAALPLNSWSNLGPAVETPAASGLFRFTDLQATNNAQRFYRAKSP
jgi:hypothetical protein